MSQDTVTISTLWPTAVLQARFTENAGAMTQEIYRLNALPGSSVKKSNYGGWQSDVNLHDNPAFAPLCGHISAVCAGVFKVKGARLHQMWACINKRGDQNLIHSHTNNFNLSGVHYLSVPQNSGEIVFRDPRPGANQAPYRLFKDDGDSEYFVPAEGLTLLFPSWLEHFVLPNQSDSDRISVSFDLTLER